MLASGHTRCLRRTRTAVPTAAKGRSAQYIRIPKVCHRAFRHSVNVSNLTWKCVSYKPKVRNQRTAMTPGTSPAW